MGDVLDADRKPLMFDQIVQSGLLELLQARPDFQFLEPAQQIYAEVLISYLKGDVLELRKWISLLESKPEIDDSDVALALAKLRLRIREHQFDGEPAREMLLAMGLKTHWRGEIHFVLAMSYGIESNFQEESDHYLKSYLLFNQAGCERKAYKAFLNHVAAESSLFPEKHFLAEHILISKNSLRLGELSIAGVALLNISREYQKIRAFQIALKYANEAIECLSKDVGMNHYFFALLHRCHILIELGRIKDAILDLEAAKINKFPEVQQTIQLLEQLILKAGSSQSGDVIAPSAETPSPKAFSKLPPTWRERKEETFVGNIEVAAQLSAHEGHLLEMLSLQPQDKFDLIHSLYGDDLPFDVVENRLKNLILRLRKKLPESLIFENGKYCLSKEFKLRNRLKRV